MITDFLTGLAILAAFITGGEAPQPELNLGAFGDPFLSIQLAASPSNGNCLTTNGTENAWGSCGSGGSGSFPFSATTNYGQVVYATSTPTLWFQSGLFASSTSRFVHASTTAFNATFGSTTYATSTALTATTGFFTDIFIGVDTIAEYVADTAGAMFTGNTESGITVAYQDADNTLDFTVSAGVANLASADFGDWTCNGSACTIDADAVALGTDTTGNYLATLSSSGSITVAGSGSETAAATVNLNMGNANTWTSLQTFSSGLLGTASSTILDLTTIRATSTNATTTNLYVTNPPTFSTLTSALLITGSTGILAEYAGASCTNQVVTALSTLGATTCTTINGNYLDLTANYAWTGAHDFGGGIIEITNGSNPTVDAIGEIALDTTSNYLLVATSTNAGGAAVLPPFQTISFTYATTSWTGTTTLMLGPAFKAQEFKNAYCETTTGTVMTSLNDGTNRATDINASTTVNLIQVTGSNTFTAGETRRIDLGNPASSPVKVACTLMYVYTRD